MAVAGGKTARARGDAVVGVAMELVGAVALDLQHPAAVLEGKFPHADEMRIEAVRLRLIRSAGPHGVLGQEARIGGHNARAWRRVLLPHQPYKSHAAFWAPSSASSTSHHGGSYCAEARVHGSTVAATPATIIANTRTLLIGELFVR